MQSGQCRGRPRADRALMLTYVVYMTMAVNALAMAWPRNACGAPRAAFAAQDQAYGVLAGRVSNEYLLVFTFTYVY